MGVEGTAAKQHPPEREASPASRATWRGLATPARRSSSRRKLSVSPGGAGPPPPPSSHTPFMPPTGLAPATLPGDRKRTKLDPPGISSSPSSLSEPPPPAKREDAPYTHSHPTPIPSSRGRGHPGVLAGPGRDAAEKRKLYTPGGNLPGVLVGQGWGGGPAPAEPRCRSSELWRRLAGSTRARGPLSAPDPSGPPLRRARAPARAPRLHPAEVRARVMRTLLRLAIIYTHACGSPGSSGNGCALAFLSAGAQSSAPFLPGCNLFYLVSGTGWALQRSVSRRPPPVRLTVTG
nr:collagen alpha-1(X) chain-like [Kogia breviceps]